MDNLAIYNAVREVPQEAQKTINGGRLKGMTDINPQWRIKALTEQFGPCGIGWYTEITKQWTEPGNNGELAAFVNINLYVKIGSEWSKPIPGTGGSMFVAKEKNGLYVSDECYKMAYTDAISVACKALGFGADIYWQADKTKYSDKPEQPKQSSKEPKECTKQQVSELFSLAKERKEKFPDFVFMKLLDTMMQQERITTKYPYADQSKTKINWTIEDYQSIKDELLLPF